MSVIPRSASVPSLASGRSPSGGTKKSIQRSTSAASLASASRASKRTTERSTSALSRTSRRKAGKGKSDQGLCLQSSGPFSRPAATLKREELSGPPVFSTRISEALRSRSESADARLEKALQTRTLEDLRDAFSKSLDDRKENHVTNSRLVLRVQLMILRMHDKKLQEAMDADETNLEELRDMVNDAEGDEAMLSRGKSKTLISAKKFLARKEREKDKALGIRRPTHFDDPKYQADTIHKLKSMLRAAAYDNGKQRWDLFTDHADKDNDGLMNWQEFHDVVRKIGKIDEGHLSEQDLHFLWNHINVDHDDSIDFKTEFLPWVQRDGA